MRWGGHRRRVGPIGAREAATERPRVALVGPRNAGESTLCNALLGRRRAVVSDRPGTTRDALAERLALDHGVEVDLVDLAGLDAALASRSPVDAISRKAALDEIARADAIVLCDPAGAFERASWLPPEVDVHARPVLRVRTKADLPAAAPSGDTIDVCALDGHNLGRCGARSPTPRWGESQPASDLILVTASPRRALACCIDARALVDPDAHARDAELIADACARARCAGRRDGADHARGGARAHLRLVLHREVTLSARAGRTGRGRTRGIRRGNPRGSAPRRPRSTRARPPSTPPAGRPLRGPSAR